MYELEGAWFLIVIVLKKPKAHAWKWGLLSPSLWVSIIVINKGPESLQFSLSPGVTFHLKT